MQIKLNNKPKSLYKVHLERLNELEDNLSQATLKGYTERLNSIQKYGIDIDMDVQDINTQVIKQFTKNMKDSGIKPVTMNNILMYLHTLLMYSHDNGYLDKMPKINFMKNSNVKKVPLSDEEIAKVIAVPKKMDFVNYRNHIITLTILATGMRSRNIRELKMKDFDTHAKTLFLEATKNGTSQVIHLSPSIFKTLVAYVNRLELDDNSPLFPSQWNNHLSVGSFANTMARYYESLGVPRCTPHLLRHSFAHRLCKANVGLPTISRLLNHSSLKVTDRYINMLDVDLIDTVNEIDILDIVTPKKRNRITIK